MPKLLPPRPHSCSESRSGGRRQRAAMNPITVTRANSRIKTIRATQLIPVTSPTPARRADASARRRHAPA